MLGRRLQQGFDFRAEAFYGFLPFFEAVGGARMARESFLKIKEAESKALVSINDAREESERIVRRAEEESADAFLRFTEECRLRASERLKQAGLDARRASEVAAAETAAQCSALMEDLSARKRDAVEAVLRAIMA